MQWFVKCLRQYADFDGRARRTEFWVWRLFLGLIAMLTWGLVAVDESLGLSLFVICFIALSIPDCAVTCRRLHDTGRSGWLQLLCLVPVAGLVVFVFTHISEGHRGPNQYGPDPKSLANPFAPASGGSLPVSPRQGLAGFATKLQAQVQARPPAQPQPSGQAAWWNGPAATGAQRPTMGYCPQCGAPAHPGKFCGSCGAAL